MFRTSDIVLIAVMVAAAAFTYKTKHEAEDRQATLRKIEQQIRFEEDTIDLLKADWSLLTQPSRLQKLSQTYQAELALQPLEAHQIVGLDELPQKPLTIEDLSSQHLGGMADSGEAGQAGRTRSSPGASCNDLAGCAGAGSRRKRPRARSSSRAPARRPAARRGTASLMTMAVFFGIYATIGGRLVYFGMQDPDDSGGPASRVTASRPDIVDRNGEVLATDIKTASLFAEPRRIVDADEVIEKLSTVLPDIEVEQTYHKLKSGAGFVWLKRQLTPKQQNEIIQLGLPGIGFRTEKRRFYPAGPTASHIVGLTNIDNQGISGLEKYIDDQGLADLQASGLAVAKDLKPVKLSIDLRVQHIVHDELAQAHGALSRHRRRRRGAQRQDRRGRGDGVAARLRSEQSLQCA